MFSNILRYLLMDPRVKDSNLDRDSCDLLKVHSEIIKNNKGETVIVAVIDSGIDIDHDDSGDLKLTLI